MGSEHKPPTIRRRSASPTRSSFQLSWRTSAARYLRLNSASFAAFLQCTSPDMVHREATRKSEAAGVSRTVAIACELGHPERLLRIVPCMLRRWLHLTASSALACCSARSRPPASDARSRIGPRGARPRSHSFPQLAKPEPPAHCWSTDRNLRWTGRSLGSPQRLRRNRSCG
jgi:hypothetical protein